MTIYNTFAIAKQMATKAGRKHGFPHITKAVPGGWLVVRADSESVETPPETSRFVWQDGDMKLVTPPLEPVAEPAAETPQVEAEPDEITIRLSDGRETPLFVTGTLDGKSRWFDKRHLIEFSVDAAKVATVRLAARQARKWKLIANAA